MPLEPLNNLGTKLVHLEGFQGHVVAGDGTGSQVGHLQTSRDAIISGQMSSNMKIKAQTHCRDVNALDSNAILDDEPGRMGRIKKSLVQTCHEGHQDMRLLGMLCYFCYRASCDLQSLKEPQDFNAGTSQNRHTMYEHEHLMQ